MKISKELIEKYHLGLCSEEERKAVEEWLFEDSFEEPLKLPPGENKDVHRKQIWEGIAPVLPPQTDSRSKLLPFSRRAALRIAAAVAMLLLAWTFIASPRSSSVQAIIEADNQSDVENKEINSGLYTLALGPRTNVRIDPSQETMEFCGTLSFTPSEDITMKIVGECPKGQPPHTVMDLKGGASYIAFSYHDDRHKTELIVVEENQLKILPPIIQKQLIAQFNI